MAKASVRVKDKVQLTDRATPIDYKVEHAVNQELLLIEKARSGDIKSFSALVMLYQERAVHIAYSFLGNYEDARDIAQEAFMKTYESLKNFKAESRFYTWFYRILVNACKDFLRKKNVRQHLSFWFRRDGDSEDDPLMNIAGDTSSAAENLMDQELGDEIYKALEKLPLRQRSAFSLRYLEGMSLEATAESMGLSVGAVKANLWHAGQKMQKFLGGYLPIGG